MMQTSFRFGSVVLLAGVLAACSSSSDGPGNTGNVGGGAGTGGNNAGGGSTAGSGGSTAGGGGSTAGGGGSTAGSGGSGAGGGGSGAGGGGGTVQPTGVDQWTTLGYDTASNYHNAAETKITVANVKTLTSGWTFATNGDPEGTPSVIGNAVYVTSTGATYRFDATTGTRKWTASVGATSSPAYDDGVVYVNTGSKLAALNADTGAALPGWGGSLDSNSVGWSSPVVAGNLVLVGQSSSQEDGFGSPTFRGSVIALDKKTGVKTWQYYTVDSSHVGATVWSSVSVDLEAKMVFIATGNNYTGQDSGTSDAIIAVDLDTGNKIWVTQVRQGDVWNQNDFTLQGNPDFDFGANPILFEATINGQKTKMVGAGSKSGIFWAMNRTTGAMIWNQPLGNGVKAVGGMINNGAFDGTHILVASDRGTSTAPDAEASRAGAGGPTARLAALDPATGKIIWERQIGENVLAPISCNNSVGFMSSQSRVEAFDLANGKQLWTATLEGTNSTAAVMVNGWLYLGSGVTYLSQGLDTSHTGKTFHAFKLP